MLHSIMVKWAAASIMTWWFDKYDSSTPDRRGASLSIKQFVRTIHHGLVQLTTAVDTTSLELALASPVLSRIEVIACHVLSSLTCSSDRNYLYGSVASPQKSSPTYKVNINQASDQDGVLQGTSCIKARTGSPRSVTGSRSLL